MDNKKAVMIIHDREENGLSYRKLGKKYGMDPMIIHRLIMSNKRKQEAQNEQAITPADISGLPDDIKLLKEELRKAKLKIELQDLMIDIASKELGVDIRKKSGARQSNKDAKPSARLARALPAAWLYCTGLLSISNHFIKARFKRRPADSAGTAPPPASTAAGRTQTAGYVAVIYG